MAKSRPSAKNDLEKARRIERELRAFRRVIVTSHVRPDGDAVGSSLGLASVLRARGLKAEVVMEDEIPGRYAFLRGAAKVKRPDRVRRPAEAALISLDATSPERLGPRAAELVEKSGATIVVDHHPSNVGFGDVSWVDVRASSVGEIVVRMAEALGWEIPPAAREALYVAILTDTGRFAFANTTPAALRMAGEMVSLGVDPERVATRVYGGRSRGEWSLDVRARSSLKTEPGGRIATMGVSARDFRETGTRPSATQDFAALPRTLAGVDLGLFFYEVDGGRQTRVNVRTAKAVDADLFAGRFGGGGHRQAAGCTVEGGLDEVRARVVAEAKRFLRRKENG